MESKKKFYRKLYKHVKKYRKLGGYVEIFLVLLASLNLYDELKIVFYVLV
jgi:hypothetical protein